MLSGHYLERQSGHYLELHLQMSYERGFHSQWGGVAAGPVAGRRGEGGERRDVAVDCMVQQVTPGVPHTVGGVRTNLYKGHLVLANTFNAPLYSDVT